MGAEVDSTASIAQTTDDDIAIEAPSQDVRYDIVDSHLHYVDFLEKSDGFPALVRAQDKAGASLAARLADPRRESPLLCALAHAGCTALVMCLAMSLVGSLVFSVALNGADALQLPAIWVGTTIKNFPMALFLSIFVAGPIARAVFARCFSRLGERRAPKAADEAAA